MRPGATPEQAGGIPGWEKGGSLRGALGASLRAPLIEFYFGDTVGGYVCNVSLPLSLSKHDYNSRK